MKFLLCLESHKKLDIDRNEIEAYVPGLLMDLRTSSKAKASLRNDSVRNSCK